MRCRKPRSVLPCSEKTKLRLNSGRFGVILSLLVCAFLEFGYSCRWKQMYIVKTPAGDIHPYRHPLYYWLHQLRRQELRSYLQLP